jgi:hypothetical protein
LSSFRTLSLKARVREKERQLLRTFLEKEQELQDAQVAMATRLGEAEASTATLREALVRQRLNLLRLGIDAI